MMRLHYSKKMTVMSLKLLILLALLEMIQEVVGQSLELLMQQKTIHYPEKTLFQDQVLIGPLLQVQMNLHLNGL